MNTLHLIGAGFGGGLLLYLSHLYVILRQGRAAFPLRSVLWLLGHGLVRSYSRWMIHMVKPSGR